jgi:carbon monoxide dehydrogenase subunit G
MRVEGTVTLQAPRSRVWEALQDPAVLARTLPGCHMLESTGPDAYRLTVAAGVASIKGVYTGRVALVDQVPPDAYTLKASGQGGPGTVDATARVTLSDTPDGGTAVHYDADAVVGGMIGGVGQRVLAGVAKRTAAEFFSAVDADVLGPVPEAVEAGAAPAGAVYRPAPSAGAAPDAKTLLAAGLLGALAALAGVALGRWTARPR